MELDHPLVCFHKLYEFDLFENRLDFFQLQAFSDSANIFKARRFIRQAWKGFPGTNTLAYFAWPSMAKKKFYIFGSRKSTLDVHDASQGWIL